MGKETVQVDRMKDPVVMPKTVPITVDLAPMAANRHQLDRYASARLARS